MDSERDDSAPGAGSPDTGSTGTLRAELAGLLALGLLLGAAAYGWAVIGPGNPVYALMVAAGTFGLGPWIGKPVEHRAPQRWFQVRPSERRILKLLGVPGFDTLLERSGWNRAVADPMRSFDGTRSDLPNLERHLRGTMSAHGTAFLVHLVLSLLAAAAGHPAGALWILLPGVLIHLYPTLLQRWTYLRIQPLLPC